MGEGSPEIQCFMGILFLEITTQLKKSTNIGGDFAISVTDSLKEKSEEQKSDHVRSYEKECT